MKLGLKVGGRRLLQLVVGAGAVLLAESSSISYSVVAAESASGHGVMSPSESANAINSLARTGRCPFSIFQIVAWVKSKHRSAMCSASSSWLMSCLPVSRLACQVVVEPDEDLELGQGLLPGIDAAQGVREGAGHVGDDVGVAGVGFGVAGMQVGQAAHGQHGQVGDLAAPGAGNGDGQRPDRGGLIDHHHYPAAAAELGEQGAQPLFVVGPWLVVQFLAGGSRAQAWCSPLPTSNPRNTAYSTLTSTLIGECSAWSQALAPTAGIHVTARR